MSELGCEGCAARKEEEAQLFIASSAESDNLAVEPGKAGRKESSEGESPVYLRCDCCEKTWCGSCFLGHKEGREGAIVCQEC